MTDENIDLLRQALLGRAGPDAFYDLLDARVEWDVSRAPGSPTIVQGRDAVRAFLPTWRHGWEYWRFEDDDFVGVGNRVVTIARDLARSSSDRAAVWTFHQGKVVRFVWYERASEALAAAGSARANLDLS